MKVVGKRTARNRTPEESLRVAERLISEAKVLARRQPRKSFVAKFRTHADYEAWKRAQSDPRYWW
jgi:hypothetical protein